MNPRMSVLVQWTQHNRRYTIGLETFLKTMELDVTDEQITKAAKHLLEQNEMEDISEQPKH